MRPILNQAFRGVLGKSFWCRSNRTFSIKLDSFVWRDSHVGIEAASTPPSSWYTDATFYNEVEKKQTFRKWQLVARASQVDKEGDYFATTIAGQPIVVVKHQDTYKAYYNVCRHHAAVMCDEGQGNVGPSGRISCPYHGWQYSLDGRLAKAVKMSGCKNFSPKDFSLHSLPVEKLGPWLFVNLGNDVASLKDCQDTQEIFQLLKDSNYEGLTHIHSRSYTLNCNWKVFIDNYLDGGYHVPVAHKALSANLNLSHYSRREIASGKSDISPRFYLQTCPAAPPSTTSEGPGDRVRGAQDALYVFQYPNICINRYGAWMDTNIVYPLTVNTCIVHFDWFVDHKYTGASDLTNQKYLEESIAASDVVQQEDVWLCERVQRGLESTAYDVGRYAPSLEGGEYMFHSLLNRDILQQQASNVEHKK